jgi:hypothetical protein
MLRLVNARASIFIQMKSRRKIICRPRGKDWHEKAKHSARKFIRSRQRSDGCVRRRGKRGPLRANNVGVQIGPPQGRSGRAGRVSPIRLKIAGDGASLLALARKRKLTVYDAAYLELAKREGLPLATLDRGLEQAAIAEGVVLFGA